MGQSVALAKRVRIFRNKAFTRFAERARLTDAVLRTVIDELEAGLVDADLGGGVVKQRIARAGAGKSGGFRTIILFRAEKRAIFVYGFAKSDRGNIDAGEPAAFRMLAGEMLAYDDAALARAVHAGVLTEVTADD